MTFVHVDVFINWLLGKDSYIWEYSSRLELFIGIKIFYDAGDIIEERFRKRRDRFAETQSGFLKQHIPTTGDDNEIDGKRAVVDATFGIVPVRRCV